MSTLELVQANTQLGDNPLYVYNNNGDRFDISEQPMMDYPNTLDIIGSEKLIRKGKPYGRYMYNGVPVPRVTSILDFADGNNEALMEWAASLGSEYKVKKQYTLDIGTKVHEAIAEYLTSGTTYCLKNLHSGKKEVMQCLKNFMAWYNNVTVNLGWKAEIYLSEVPLICPWFGGTADAILDLNGRRFLVDFKSSKKISTSYFLQVSAYKWIVDNYYPELGPIDGVGILRFDKFKDKYEDLFMEAYVPEDAQFIAHCQQSFWLALNQFYYSSVLYREMMDIKKTKKQNTGKISKGLAIDPIRNKRKG